MPTVNWIKLILLDQTAFFCLSLWCMVQLNLNMTFTCMWHKNFWTNFSCHSRVSHEQIIKIYIYTHVTLESLDKFIRSLASCTQSLNKFDGLLACCTQALNKFVGPLTSCTRAHDLMHSWSALLARTMAKCISILRNNSFINSSLLPFLCEKTRAIALAQLGLTAGRQTKCCYI